MFSPLPSSMKIEDEGDPRFVVRPGINQSQARMRPQTDAGLAVVQGWLIWHSHFGSRA